MIQLFILLTIFSFDSLLVSISYSIKKISISFKSILLISSISSISLLISLIIGSEIKNILNPLMGNIMCFIFLLLLGLYNIFQDKIKIILSKNNKQIIKIYLDETNADLDNSKSLNFKESIFLSIVLSLDSLIGGISIGFMNYSIIHIVILSLVLNIIFIFIGNNIGKKIGNLINFNSNYITGIILIILGIFKIL